MKNIRMILVFLVAGVFILAGCPQSETPTTTTPSIDSQSGATSNY
ncbi:MAG: hypothetical protein ACRC3J_04360 [Culicoidibacterales bacterium]